MKKLSLFIAAVLIFALADKALSNAPLGPTLIHAPYADRDALQSADYGGVEYSTISFSSANVLGFQGLGVVYGFVWSSGTTSTDFISISDTGSLISGAINGANPGNAADDYTTTNEIARVYLSTSGLFSTDTGRNGGTYAFPKPIRVRQGCAAKVSVATYNKITILWTPLHKVGP